jgi:hypothetical protein
MEIELDDRKTIKVLEPPKEKPIVYGSIHCDFCGRPANYVSKDALRQWLNLSTNRKDVKNVCKTCLNEGKKALRKSKKESFEKYLASLIKPDIKELAKLKQEEKDALVLEEKPRSNLLDKRRNIPYAK